MSVGIDVGSTTFRLAQFLSNRADLVSGAAPPAVVAVGSDRLLVGRDARRELDTKHDNVYRFPVSRIVLTEPSLLVHPKGGEREMWPEAAAAALFSQMEGVYRRKGAPPLKHLCLSVPPSLTALERNQLSVAAVAAKLPKPDFISSNVAATLQWAHTSRKPLAAFPMYLLVVDCGAKFTSVSTIRVDNRDSLSVTVLSNRVFRYGGHAVDLRMMHLAPNHPAVLPRTVWAAVEKSKKELSSLKDSEIRVKEKTRLITRSQLTSAAAPLLQRISEAAHSAIDELPASVRVSHALLVGGSSRMTGLQNFVANELKLHIEVADYDSGAALGAALWAAQRGGLTKSPLVQGPNNNLQGHRYFAIRLDPDTADPTDEIQELFTKAAVTSELRDLGRGTWAVLEHQRGSRGYLSPSQLAAYLKRQKEADVSEGQKVEVVVSKVGNDPDIGVQFLEYAPDASDPPGAKPTVVLGSVVPGSQADSAGLHSYEGWKVCSVNGSAVQAALQIEDMIRPARVCVLELKHAQREELPPAAGDVEPWEAVFIGWTRGGTLRIDQNGLITGLALPDDDMLSEEELRIQLEADANLNTHVQAYCESRNLLEAATLRMEEAELAPKDLTAVCTNAPHYFNVAENVLKSDESPYDTDDIKLLSGLIDRMLDAYTDDKSLTSSVSQLEGTLRTLTPSMAPGNAAEGRGRNRSLTLTGFKKKTLSARRGLPRVPSISPDEQSHLQRARSVIRMSRRNVDDKQLSPGSLSRKRSWRKDSLEKTPKGYMLSPRNNSFKGPFKLSASVDSLSPRSSPSSRGSKNSMRGDVLLSPGPVKRRTGMSPARGSMSPARSPRNPGLSPNRASSMRASPSPARSNASLSPRGGSKASLSPARSMTMSPRAMSRCSSPARGAVRTKSPARDSPILQPSRTSSGSRGTSSPRNLATSPEVSPVHSYGSITKSMLNGSFSQKEEEDRMNRSFKAMTDSQPIPMLQVLDGDIDDLIEIKTTLSEDSDLDRSDLTIASIRSASPTKAKGPPPGVAPIRANGHTQPFAQARTAESRSPSPRHSLLQNSGGIMRVEVPMSPRSSHASPHASPTLSVTSPSPLAPARQFAHHVDMPCSPTSPTSPESLCESSEDLPVRRTATQEGVASPSMSMGVASPSSSTRVGLSQTVGALFPIRSRTPPSTRRWNVRGSMERVVSRAVRRVMEGSPPGAVEDPVELASFLSPPHVPHPADEKPPKRAVSPASTVRGKGAKVRDIPYLHTPQSTLGKSFSDFATPRRKSASMTQSGPVRWGSPREVPTRHSSAKGFSTPVRASTATHAQPAVAARRTKSPPDPRKASMRFNLPAHGEKGEGRPGVVGVASPRKHMSSTFSGPSSGRNHALVVSSPQWEEIPEEGIPCRWAPTTSEVPKQQPVIVARSKSPVIIGKASPRTTFSKSPRRFTRTD